MNKLPGGLIWCKRKVIWRVIDQKSCHFLAPILRVPAAKWSNFWGEKKLVMSLSISLHKFKILISLQDVQKIMRIFTSFYSDYSNFLIKYGFLHNFVAKKSLWQSFKNEKSKTAIFFNFPCSFLCCTLFFSVYAFFMEKITKQNRLFWLFWKKAGKRRFCFAIFSMKNA